MADKATKNKEQFEGQWKRIVSASGVPNPEKNPKIPQSKVVEIFQKLAEERNEKAEETFKTQLTGIFEAKLALDKNLDAGRKELAKKEEAEYEKLNKMLSDALGKLETVKGESSQMVQQASGETEEPASEA